MGGISVRPRGPVMSSVRRSDSAIQEVLNVNGDETDRLIENHKSYTRAWPPQKVKGGDVLKSIVYGGLDGIISTFAIVAGVQGGRLDPRVIVVLGFAALVADAMSMGIGDALSSLAEDKFALSEKARAVYEMANHTHDVVEAMVNAYLGKGYEEDDARQIVALLAKKPEAFVDAQLKEAEGLLPADDGHPWHAWKAGAVTAVSFIVCGAIPLSGYVVSVAAFPAAKRDEDAVKWGTFGVACALTALTMFALGCVKARFTRENFLKSGLVTTGLGVLAAAAAFGLSYGLEQAVCGGTC